jgi:hypothetical protein
MSRPGVVDLGEPGEPIKAVDQRDKWAAVSGPEAVEGPVLFRCRLITAG